MKTKAHIRELLYQYRCQFKKAILAARYGNISAMNERLNVALTIEEQIIDDFDEGERAIAELVKVREAAANDWLESLGL
jgi:hypothetical protein